MSDVARVYSFGNKVKMQRLEAKVERKMGFIVPTIGLSYCEEMSVQVLDKNTLDEESRAFSGVLILRTKISSTK